MYLQTVTARGLSRATHVRPEYCEYFLRLVRQLAPAGSTVEYLNLGRPYPCAQIDYPKGIKPWVTITFGLDAAGRTTIWPSTSDRVLVIRESIPRGARRSEGDFVVSLSGLAAAMQVTLRPPRPQTRGSGRR